MDVDFGKVINKNQLLGWRWAPMCDAVRRSPVLSDGAKILYNEIVSFMWQKDNIRAWPNQQTLADNLSISRQAISRRLKELEAVGLLGIQRNGLGKSSDIYLYDLDLGRLQVGQDDTGAFRPMSQLDAASNTTVRPASAPRCEPVVPPDVTLPLHQDVKETLHQDVTLGLHQDVTIATRDEDDAGASGSDDEAVCANGISAEEETGEVINREEEAAPAQPDSPTTLGSPKPNLPRGAIASKSSPVRDDDDATPSALTINRRDIPKGITSTWNPALTEESVVIDGERYLIQGDGEALEVEGAEGVERTGVAFGEPCDSIAPRSEVVEIEVELLDPSVVEAEMSDEEIAVNQEKMAKLLSSIGGDLNPAADDSNNSGAPPSMSREEMRAKLLAMDIDAGGAEKTKGKGESGKCSIAPRGDSNLD